MHVSGGCKWKRFITEYDMAIELLGGQRQRLKAELPGLILKAMLQNWATEVAAVSLVIRLPSLGLHAGL